MGAVLAVVLAVGLTLVGGLLLVIGRRQDLRRRRGTPTATRSTSGVALIVPVVVLAVSLVALFESPSTIRLHVGLLGLGAAACAAAGSYYVLRYAKRTLRTRQGQPWTSDRVASVVLYLLAIGLAITAINLSSMA